MFVLNNKARPCKGGFFLLPGGGIAAIYRRYRGGIAAVSRRYIGGIAAVSRPYIGGIAAVSRRKKPL